MPTYQFQCNCGYKEEELKLPSKRNEPKECPKCKKLMDRLVSGGAGIIFKGDGFYCNDHPKGD